jgi:hypothetical protein
MARRAKQSKTVHIMEDRKQREKETGGSGSSITFEVILPVTHFLQ